MIKESAEIFYGAAIWKIWQLRFRINSKTVVLVLVNENKSLDRYALIHLKKFANRKYARKAVLIVNSKTIDTQMKKMKFPFSAKMYFCPKNEIEWVYRYYSFYKFSDKLVFTFISCPKDNQLGRLLKETEVNEEEAVCLGLYRLRKVFE